MLVSPNALRFVGMFLFVAVVAVARSDYREFRALSVSSELDAKVKRAAEVSLKKFPRLTANNLALTVIDLSAPEKPVRADYQGDASFYPASLVKLFFMVAAFHRD